MSTPGSDMKAFCDILTGEPMTLAELEDYLVGKLGMDRSRIVVHVEAQLDNQLKLRVPFEQH